MRSLHVYLFGALCLGLAFCYTNVSLAQTLRIATTLLDQQTKAPIAYATVYNLTQQKGTVSNLDGFFELRSNAENDSLQISFIGYKSQTFILTAKGLPAIIHLEPQVQNLAEAIVLGDNTLLYHLVSKAKKTQAKKMRPAKTYFLLESFINQKQVELLEAYYNGEFYGYNVSKLNMKNGRVALAQFSNRFFKSTETSKAVTLHKFFNDNNYFPDTPYQLSKGQLKKLYSLELSQRYTDEDNRRIYVVHCIPKKDPKRQFESTIWLDSLSGQILKTELLIKDAKNHPFAPSGSIKKVDQVDLEITKNYRELDGEMYVKSVDFNYNVQYTTAQHQQLKVRTNAVLYAYQYDRFFVEPQFVFNTGTYRDYKQINATPYNHFFWNNINEFGLSIDKEKINRFVAHKASIDNQTLFIRNPYFQKNGSFEFPYVHWNKERIQFREAKNDSINYNAYRGVLPSDRYNLNVQIYLDVNRFSDSLHVITKTVFDPYDSFYYYPNTPHGMAFINMYFDLMEMKRRELEMAITDRNALDEEAIIMIYKLKKAEAEKTGEQFLKEVDRGTEWEAMIKWNNKIREAIGIDNIEIFQLTKPIDD